MRAAAMILAVLLSSCNDSAPVAPAATAAPVAPALTDIPATDGRPIATDSDMRVLEPFTGDLDAMIERGVIRILAAPGATHFESEATIQRGRTVDAAIAFERFVNQRIAPRAISVRLIETNETGLIDGVEAGQGDIAANLLRTFERDEQVAFAKPMRTGVRELIVTGPGVPPLVSLEDVGGRTIHVRRNSDHHASLVRLNDQLKKITRPPAKIVFADGQQTDENLLFLVNKGHVPATIVDDYIYDAHKAQLLKTAVNRDVAVSQDGEIAWVTRKGSSRLLELINDFFATHRLSF